MALPPTYYDFVRKLRPTLVEKGEQDAADLLSGPNPPLAIHSVDDYDSRFPQYIERLNAEILGYGADHPGVSVEEMSPFLSSAPPQAKASLSSLYGTVSNEYHSVVNFALAGKKTFHFSDNLAEHLANTEINLKAALIQLPFPTCLFTFTSRAVINAMHNIRGDAGRWAMNITGLDYSAPVSVFLTMHPAGAGLPGRKLLICAWHAKLPDTSYLAIKRELYLGDNWTLEQALRTDWETLTPNDLGSGLCVNLSEASIAHQDDDTFYTDGLAFFRIVLNAVLYLSSDKADLTAKESPRKEIEDRANGIASLPKRRKLLQTTGRYSALDYEEVGASVGPIVIQKGEAEGGEDGSGGGKPLVRFMVRGH
ncbi:hypothetical protein B447_14909 [Thauera sp. 27]|uniref:hypothetical protein n=1 Tax=Thauera sp. 27 TaxID=305700 RepID=UPI0002CF1B50|nr:hypothetical protein [Thauera sp. 27]ENO78013.1 hypothetical protein B447_14909 [Thauera sp. 27]